MRTRKPTEVPASLKTVNVKALLRSRGIYFKQKVNQDMKQAALPLAKKMLAKKPAKTVKAVPQKYHNFTDVQAQEYWEKQIHIVHILEDKFDKKVQQFITKMVDGFLSHLDSEVTNKTQMKKFEVKGYFDESEDELLTAAQLDFTPLLEQQAILAGQEAYKLINSNDVYMPYKLRETIAENVTKFTQSMIDTDRQTLIDIIANAVQDGKSVPEIRGAIQTSFESISKTQAQRITRTEVLRVSNQASIDAYEQSGVVEGKQWLTAGADDECANYEGEIVTLSGNFYDSDNEFQDGDPPLHPNCRCVVLPVLVGENG